MISFLKGKRTYITAALGGIVLVAQLLGYIPAELADKLYILLGFTGMVTLRSSIASAK